MINRTTILSISAILLATGSLSAQQATIFQTDRLGYTTTATRYNTLADLQSKTNPVDFVTIGDRDIRVLSVDETFNQIYSSFYYSTAPLPDPDDPESNKGVDNTRGNTGPGFMQIYDLDFSTVSSFDMKFGGWDGTYWTKARLQISGSDDDDTIPGTRARFSVYDNNNDTGIYHSYNLDLTVTGLEGFDLGGGFIAALNHPTGVSGKLNAVFQMTGNETSSANQGFYDIEMTFNMNNWSWDNRDELTYPADGFYDSVFVAPVPEPATIGLLSILGMAGLLVLRRRLKK